MIIWLWIGFLVFILAMLALDLGVFHRRDHVVSIREAMGWTVAWIAMALLFNVLVFFIYEYHWMGVHSELSGVDAAMKYLAGYLVEKSLSLDNIFVIALIFAYFHVPASAQHRVLFWGVLGALVLRGLLIGVGAALVREFDWIMYVFAVLLLYAAWKMATGGAEEIQPDRNPLVRLTRRLWPVAGHYDGSRFRVTVDGRWMLTPLFIVLLVVESTDVLFAVDSVPAIFAITDDPFLIFTSNVFAILGLRSLYFALAGVLRMFHLMKYALVALLIYIAIKMLLIHFLHIPTWVSLVVIVLLLTAGLVASMLWRPAAETTLATAEAESALHP